MHQRLFFSFLFGLILFPGLWWGSQAVHAQVNIEQLQTEIRDRNNRLSEIEKEIAKFESSLKEVGAEKKTLQSAIARLELERGKVQAEIKYTEQKINSTDLEINKLILVLVFGIKCSELS